MSVIYTLFENAGRFRSYSIDEKQKTYELTGGIWKNISKDEWDINYTTNNKLPQLDTSNDTVSWISRPNPKGK
jgi:hypothetical protein